MMITIMSPKIAMVTEMARVVLLMNWADVSSGTAGLKGDWGLLVNGGAFDDLRGSEGVCDGADNKPPPEVEEVESEEMVVGLGDVAVGGDWKGF